MAIDNKDYLKWEKFTTPEGGVFYRVPNSDLYFDPILSQAKGKNVYRQNLKSRVEAEQATKDQQQAQIDLQKQAASPAGQLVPIVGTVGGTIAAGAALNGGILGGGAAATGAGTAAGVGAGAAAGTGAAVGTGTAAGVGAAGAGTGAAATGAGATAAGAAPVAAVAPAAGVALPIVGGVGAAVGSYLIDKQAQKMLGGDANKPQGLLARYALTGGLGTSLGLTESFFGHKKTKDVINDRWSKLAEEGAITPEQLAAKQADLERSDRGTDPITGKSWDLKTAVERVKAGGAAADEFAQTYGPQKLYGVDWNSYTPDQKRAIIKANADADNWTSDKGDVLFKDEEKAKQIKDQVLAGTLGTSSDVIIPSSRSSTRSPGIGMDGKRIGNKLAERMNARA